MTSAASITLEEVTEARTSEDQVCRAVLSRLYERREHYLAEYKARFGNVLNADDAAELFEEYAASLRHRTLYRVAVHPAAQWIRDELFRRELEQSDPSG